eukprot:Pompholyxophrys_punicea_v1_NODE_6_length_8794_cov_7.233894.p8 type:complete len:140 gc:universal NODE_6_length_8794_cov_7.233894:7780-8199(+)
MQPPSFVTRPLPARNRMPGRGNRRPMQRATTGWPRTLPSPGIAGSRWERTRRRRPSPPPPAPCLGRRRPLPSSCDRLRVSKSSSSQGHRRQTSRNDPAPSQDSGAAPWWERPTTWCSGRLVINAFLVTTFVNRGRHFQV